RDRGLHPSAAQEGGTGRHLDTHGARAGLPAGEAAHCVLTGLPCAAARCGSVEQSSPASPGPIARGRRCLRPCEIAAIVLRLQPSIRRQLIFWLVLPLSTALICSALVVYKLASDFVTEA